MAAADHIVRFDNERYGAELREFGTALADGRLQREKPDILPFFKQRQQLSLSLANFNVHASTVDWLATEFEIGGEFRADLIAGDRARAAYCLVEFEDAADTSVFAESRRRKVPIWSPRFEGGFSQLVDWFWKLDEMRGQPTFRTDFGEQPTFAGLLVLGRDQHLELREQDRLKWRARNVLIGGQPVQCLTYDELFGILEGRRTQAETRAKPTDGGDR